MGLDRHVVGQTCELLDRERLRRARILPQWCPTGELLEDGKPFCVGNVHQTVALAGVEPVDGPPEPPRRSDDAGAREDRRVNAEPFECRYQLAFAA